MPILYSERIPLKFHLTKVSTLRTARPRTPVTSDTALSTVPVTLATDPLAVDPTVDTLVSTASNAPSVDEPPTEVDFPEPHSEDDVDELVTVLLLKPTSHAAEALDVQPPRRTGRCVSHVVKQYHAGSQLTARRRRGRAGTPTRGFGGRGRAKEAALARAASSWSRVGCACVQRVGTLVKRDQFKIP
jgi:hypothetical protein